MCVHHASFLCTVGPADLCICHTLSDFMGCGVGGLIVAKYGIRAAEECLRVWQRGQRMTSVCVCVCISRQKSILPMGPALGPVCKMSIIDMNDHAAL